MWKTVLAAILGVMVLHCGAAHAARPCNDMSWWGSTGANPEPKADSKGRAGCWWFPVETGQLWGNRGVVFHEWKGPIPRIVKESPTPQQEKSKGRCYVTPPLECILFDAGKAVLKPDYKSAVDKMVVELKKYEHDTVEIEGHASSEGDKAHSMALGLRRAETVKNYIVESGIDPKRLKTVSYGESRPMVPNDSPVNRKLNRRVEFKLTLRDY